MSGDYVSVTEIAGDEVTQEQVDRLCNRYYWAGQYCSGKDDSLREWDDKRDGWMTA